MKRHNHLLVAVLMTHCTNLPRENLSKNMTENLTQYVYQSNVLNLNVNSTHSPTILDEIFKPIPMLLIGATTAYAVTWYRMIRTGIAVQHERNWSAWKKEITNQELFGQNYSALAQELWTSIEEKYHNQHHLQDKLRLCMKTIHDIDAETEQLTTLHRLHSGVRSLLLRYLFPRQKSIVASIPGKIQRLEFIKLLVSAYIQNMIHSKVT